MTLDELRQKYATAYKIIQRERRMREHVFRNDPVASKQKMAEMDRLLEILVVMKDFCKEHVQGEIEQTTLFDLPKPTQYQ